jgi:trimethylamine--corrinoid protein Co-methyltransferase
MRNFTNAFFRSEIFDYKDIDQWVDDGSVTAAESAADKVKNLLAEYEAPVLDPELDQELQDFIAQRKEEIKAEG